jgi:hypothetical protein
MTKTPPYEFKAAWEEFAERREQLSPAETQLLDSQLDECAKTLDRVRDELDKYPNVFGTGVSMKIKNGEVLDQPCIVISVTKKIPNMKEGSVPAYIDGWPTDVIETKVPKLIGACSIQPGNSIQNPVMGEGTLGCLVRDLSDEGRRHIIFDRSPFSDILLLTNNHVIATEKNLVAKSGDPIILPGFAGFHSAYLVRWIDLKKPPEVNEADAAVAKPIAPVDPDILGIGIPKDIRKPKVGERVKKSGLKSGITFGEVKEIDAQYPVPYPSLGDLKFKNLILTTNKAQHGDSGSLLLDNNGLPSDPKNNNGLGLIFASGDFTFSNSLQRVLNLLNVELVTSFDWPPPT